MYSNLKMKKNRYSSVSITALNLISIFRIAYESLRESTRVYDSLRESTIVYDSLR